MLKFCYIHCIVTDFHDPGIFEHWHLALLGFLRDFFLETFCGEIFFEHSSTAVFH